MSRRERFYVDSFGKVRDRESYSKVTEEYDIVPQVELVSAANRAAELERDIKREPGGSIDWHGMVSALRARLAEAERERSRVNDLLHRALSAGLQAERERDEARERAERLERENVKLRENQQVMEHYNNLLGISDQLEEKTREIERLRGLLSRAGVADRALAVHRGDVDGCKWCDLSREIDAALADAPGEGE